MIFGSTIGPIFAILNDILTRFDYYCTPLSLNFEDGLVMQEADGGYGVRTHSNVMGNQFEDTKNALAGIRSQSKDEYEGGGGNSKAELEEKLKVGYSPATWFGGGLWLIF